VDKRSDSVKSTLTMLIFFPIYRARLSCVACSRARFLTYETFFWMDAPPAMHFGSPPSVRLLGAGIARAQAPQAAPGPPLSVPSTCSTQGLKQSARNGFWRKCARGWANSTPIRLVEQDIAALYKTGSIHNVRIFAQPEGMA